MICGKVICQECATEWDGINHCASCLSRRRTAAREGGSALGWIAVAAATLALIYLTQKLMVWGSVLWA